MAGEIQLNSTTMATESSGSITAQLDTIRPNTTNGSLTLQGDSSNAGVTGLTIDSSGNATFAGTANNLGTVTAGTLGSNVVFPAGHIVQSVMNPTISNYDATAGTSVKFGDLIGQITITSGNGVLIFASLPVNCVPNTNGQYIVEIREGTIASTGDLLAHNYHYNGSTTLTTRVVHTMWAYDSSPASTTPSYIFKADRASSGTTSVQSPHDPSTSPGDKMFYCFLFEIKQ